MDAVRVEVGACRCPGMPHPDGDWVELHPHVTPQMGVAAIVKIRETPADTSMMEAALAGVFLHHGIRAWSFVDEAGAMVPVTFATIDERLDWSAALPVVERATELYGTELFDPLGLRRSSSSPNGPTAPSTSATTDGGRKRPKHSKRSSPTPSAGKPSEDPDR